MNDGGMGTNDDAPLNMKDNVIISDTSFSLSEQINQSPMFKEN